MFPCSDASLGCFPPATTVCTPYAGLCSCGGGTLETGAARSTTEPRAATSVVRVTDSVQTGSIQTGSIQTGSIQTGNVRLIVLYGGRSAEHDVSCVSAGYVASCARAAGMEVVTAGICRSGAWVLPTTPEAREGEPLPSPTEDDPPVEITDILGSLGGTLGGNLCGTDGDVKGGDSRAIDPDDGGETPGVVFPVLHGPFGEDGTIQGLCESLNVPYVGTGVLSSAMCMDKPVVKELLNARGLPVTRWKVVKADSVSASAASELLDELGSPVFVKPANMGSSIGISKARSRDDLLKSLALAAEFDELALLEETVDDAREIEVSILGNIGALRASLPGEIVPSREFYDYEDKYLCGAAMLLSPAELPRQTTEEVRSLALEAADALRVEGLARVDFLYGKVASAPERRIFVNEINTMPGFTPISMFPRLWEATGITGRELVAELVRLAIERHRRRASHRRLNR